MTNNKGIPGVIISNSDLKVLIGEWLGVLTIQPYHFNSENILKSNIHRLEDIAKVETKFGEVLKIVGIPVGFYCRLNDYKKEEDRTAFNCNILYDDKRYKIVLNNETEDTNSSLEISDDMIKKIYYYQKAKDDKEMNLILNDVIIKNARNGVELHESFHSSSYHATASDGANEIDINIDYPKYLDKNKSSKYLDRAKLQKYLLNTSFNVNIEDLYKKLAELSKQDISCYRYVEIRILRNKDSILEDGLLVIDGEFSHFTRRIGDKTVTLDNNDYWQYITPNYHILQDATGKFIYGYNNKKTTTPDLITKPSTYITGACKEVAKIKVLLQNTLNK